MTRMSFTKLVIQGTAYRRTIAFDKGLTIIRGDKTSGKSLVLNLIDYCLGRTQKIDLTVQRELSLHCDRVFLEVTQDEETFTIGRLLKERQSKFNLYYCSFDELDGYTPKVVSQEELMQFLMRKLHLSEYKLVKHQRHSDKQELETVSFRDVFRYVYVHQHELGTSDFLSHKDGFKRYKNPRAFEVLFNLVSPDIDNVKQQIVDAKNKIADTKTEIVGLKSYLRDKDAEDYTNLWLKHEHNLNEIKKRSKEKASIVNDSKGDRNEETEMYATLKQELTEIVNQIARYERERNDYLLSVSSKRFLRQEYENEREEILATLELNYTLVIPDQTIECPLCKSLVPHRGHESREANSVGTLKRIEEELRRKIQLVTRMIDNDNKAIEELDMKISQIRKRQSIFSDAAMEFTKELDVPFLSQIDSINSIVNQLNMEQETLKECLRMHRKITEKAKLIEDLEGEASRLNAELDNLYVSETLTNSTFAFLTQQYKQFMARLKYEVDAEAYIHTDTYLPYYRGSNVYSHESGGLQLCMQLSYLFAIITSKSEGYCSGHPGILMLDSLSKYLGTLKSGRESRQTIDELEKSEKDLINDPEVYDEIYKIVVELSSEYQIIIVENTPPSLVNNSVKYTFLSGEKGLINLEVNEFSKID